MAKENVILIIDDSNTNIVLLDAVLVDQGYKVLTAYNATDAHGILKKEKVDLILLDLLMPKISGFDFLKEIKKSDELKSIPVIIVSAHYSPDSKIEAEKLGALDYILKPVDIQNLLNKVDNALNT